MPLKMFQKQDVSSKNRIEHIVAIAAGKGGVGKSSITVNLALALKQAGYSVGIMDADIYGPSIRKMLPEAQMPTQKDGKVIPAISCGIFTISMAYFSKENEATAVRAPIANGVITQFVKNVQWNALDFLLIDFPPGTGDIQLTLAQQANLTSALMVTTPQELALMDVRKAANLFEQVNVPIIGIVENMSYYQHHSTNEMIHMFGKGGGLRLANEIGVPLLGEIPIDPEICKCSDEGKSLFQDKTEGNSTISAYQVFAKEFVAHSTALKRLSSQCLTSFDIKWKEME